MKKMLILLILVFSFESLADPTNDFEIIYQSNYKNIFKNHIIKNRLQDAYLKALRSHCIFYKNRHDDLLYSSEITISSSALSYCVDTENKAYSLIFKLLEGVAVSLVANLVTDKIIPTIRMRVDAILNSNEQEKLKMEHERLLKEQDDLNFLIRHAEQNWLFWYERCNILYKELDLENPNLSENELLKRDQYLKNSHLCKQERKTSALTSELYDQLNVISEKR